MADGKDGHTSNHESAQRAAPGETQPPSGTSAEQMRHELTEGPPIVVEENSGVAAAEATGKLNVDNEAPPEATAGSG